MKRRDFLRSVGASAAATALPMGSLASAAAPVRQYGMSPYVWAKYTAQINKRLTPDMLTTFLGFSEDDAARMIRRLTTENILMAPDPAGISRTSADYLESIRKKREALKRAARRLHDLTEGDSAEGPPTEPDQPEDTGAA